MMIIKIFMIMMIVMMIMMMIPQAQVYFAPIVETLAVIAIAEKRKSEAAILPFLLSLWSQFCDPENFKNLKETFTKGNQSFKLYSLAIF